jgi:hypothetical protein
MKRRFIAASVAATLAVVGGAALWSRQQARGFP